MKKRRIAAFLLTMVLAVSQLAGTHGLTVQAALTGGEAGDSTETDRSCTHGNKRLVEKKAATCRAEGNEAYYYCEACDGYFWDEACKEVIEATDVKIPVITDHKYTDADNNNKCDICEEEQHTTHTHTYKERVDGKYLKEAATCKTKAVYYKSCECGVKGTETFTYGKVLEHKFDETITRATATKNGSIVEKCTRSGCTEKKETVIYAPKTVKLSWTTKTYTGKKLKAPTLIVTGSNKKAIDKKYYTVSGLAKQKNVGTYKVTVKFDSKYYNGIKNKTLIFSIVPKATNLKNVKAAKKGFTVTWKKQTSQTSGYQIQYATNKSFKKAKIQSVSSNKKTFCKISRLSAKKKYHVRIRTYKTVKGKKIYSSWSRAKTVTTKK